MRISDWSSDVCSSDLLRRVALGQHLHLLAVDLDVVLAGLDLARVGAVHGIILQEVRVRLGGAKVVDGDELDVLALGLHGGAKHERSEEHTSELQSLMRNSYAVFCLKKHKNINK